MPLNSPEQEQRGFRTGSPGLRLILLMLLAVALMVLDQRGSYLDQTRRLLTAGVYPVIAAVDAPFAAFASLRENLAFRRELVARNRELNEALLLQSARLQRLSALEAENARLRALLDSTANLPDRVLIAELLQVDMDPLRHRVVLNKGGRDGVYVGQALIDADGVIGQVTREHILTSEALLITDPDHAVPVEVVRNGLRTIAMGTGELDRLSLPFLTRNADIEPGDLLVTSGLGGSFPAGYPVGVIRRIDDSSGDAFREVEAEPAARLDRVREVLLVFDVKPEPDSDSDSGPGDALPDDGGPASGSGPMAVQE
jgi:rod shape-determining protein MreC